MLAQRTPTTTFIEPTNQAVVYEAMRLLAMPTMTRRWVCETCGAVHTEVALTACDSCGAISLILQPEPHREMNSRW